MPTEEKNKICIILLSIYAYENNQNHQKLNLNICQTGLAYISIDVVAIYIVVNLSIGDSNRNPQDLYYIAFVILVIK